MLKVLPFLNPSFEHLKMLLGVFRLIQKLEVGFNDIINITQDNRRTLLTIFVDIDSQIPFSFFHGLFGAIHRDLTCHFITANIHEADRSQNMDSVYTPADLWLPVDCFENTTCGRRSYDIIRNPLYFHLGTSKTSIVPPQTK